MRQTLGSTANEFANSRDTRLILREFVPTDANRLEAVLSDPETMRFYPARLNRTEVERWRARNRDRDWRPRLLGLAATSDLRACQLSDGFR